MASGPVPATSGYFDGTPSSLLSWYTVWPLSVISTKKISSARVPAVASNVIYACRRSRARAFRFQVVFPAGASMMGAPTFSPSLVHQPAHTASPPSAPGAIHAQKMSPPLTLMTGLRPRGASVRTQRLRPSTFHTPILGTSVPSRDLSYH